MATSVHAENFDAIEATGLQTGDVISFTYPGDNDVRTVEISDVYVAAKHGKVMVKGERWFDSVDFVPEYRQYQFDRMQEIKRLN